MRIVLIGAGNVATQLGKALHAAAYSIVQVYSRTEASASTLARLLGTGYTISPGEIIDDADLYVISVKDDAILPLLQTMRMGKGLYVHTAGSVPMQVFEGLAARYGVFYPLQTFSREKEVSFSQIHLFIEAAAPEDLEVLREVATKLSSSVQAVSSAQRQYLHLGAVFACNFTNHLYALAAELLNEQGIDWSSLLPLIRETVGKLDYMTPTEAQTGPAVRSDQLTMSKHLDLLRKEEHREVYRLLSKLIEDTAAKAKTVSGLSSPPSVE